MYILFSIGVVFWLALTVIGFLLILERRYWMFEPREEHSELLWTLRPLWREARCHLSTGMHRRKMFAQEIAKQADIRLEKAEGHIPRRWHFCLVMLSIVLAAAPMVVAGLCHAAYQWAMRWYIARHRHY